MFGRLHRLATKAVRRDAFRSTLRQPLEPKWLMPCITSPSLVRGLAAGGSVPIKSSRQQQPQRQSKKGDPDLQQFLNKLEPPPLLLDTSVLYNAIAKYFFVVTGSTTAGSALGFGMWRTLADESVGMLDLADPITPALIFTVGTAVGHVWGHHLAIYGTARQLSVNTNILQYVLKRAMKAAGSNPLAFLSNTTRFIYDECQSITDANSSSILHRVMISRTNAWLSRNLDDEISSIRDSNIGKMRETAEHVLDDAENMVKRAANHSIYRTSFVALSTFLFLLALITLANNGKFVQMRPEMKDLLSRKKRELAIKKAKETELENEKKSS